MNKLAYEDDYGTCDYTHAWIRVISKDIGSDAIAEKLSLRPSQTIHIGERTSKRLDRYSRHSMWLLSTEGKVDSLDARRHLDWLLKLLSPRRERVKKLIRDGCLIDCCCRWDSKSGHGGPTFSPKQLIGFGELGIEVWFDIYFAGDD